MTNWDKQLKKVSIRKIETEGCPLGILAEEMGWTGEDEE